MCELRHNRQLRSVRGGREPTRGHFGLRALRQPNGRWCAWSVVASRFKSLRIGTSRAAEELAALVGGPVGEVTGATAELPGTDVVVGTEAVLHRVGRADLVVFIDFDAELAAPHFRANEATMSLCWRERRGWCGAASKTGA